jgi:uncharacterized repeat protein (TIGR01451 family)
MNLKRTAATLVALAFVPLGAFGQGMPTAAHPAMAHPAVPQAAPLLYVRFGGTPGMQVTLFPGGIAGTTFPAPVEAGLRPGYIYRVEISGLAGLPGVALYPTIEVRGTLQLPANLRAADYPAPVILSPEDIGRILSGSLLTKVIYLEPPESALPVETLPGVALERELRPGDDILEEARSLGRPLLIVRVGTKALTPEELVRQAIPGTMLLPGEKTLGRPAAPPCMPLGNFPAYDPIAGPAPSEAECLQDGGDVGRPAGLDAAGRLRGLDPSDTVAEYKDNHGGKHLAISNRVCICVPRFAVLRMLTTPTGYGGTVTLGAAGVSVSGEVMRARLPSIEAKQAVQLQALASRQRPSEIENQEGLVDVVSVQGTARLIARLHDQTVVGTLVQQTPPPPERPLVLCKTADKQAAHIGDVVTFTLKYTNQGGQPINDVVISDSLTGRLEYVVGSAKSDREAVFTMQENQAGSLVLRWEVAGLLLPGHSGVVTFQARIR